MIEIEQSRIAAVEAGADARLRCLIADARQAATAFDDTCIVRELAALAEHSNPQVRRLICDAQSAQESYDDYCIVQELAQVTL